MSVSTSKLYHRKTPHRKILRPNTICKNEYDSVIKLKLGELETTFDKGRWIPRLGPYDKASQENSYLKMQINELEEENNLLKLKYEILLNMLTHQSLSNEL